MICQPGSSSSNSPDNTATWPGMIRRLCPTFSATPKALTALAMRSASNLPAAQAVSTLMPSASATINQAGQPEPSTSLATEK